MSKAQRMSKQRSHEDARRPYRRRAQSARLQSPRYYTTDGGWHILYPPVGQPRVRG